MPMDSGRRERLDAFDLLGLTEEAEDLAVVRSRGAWRTQSFPFFGVQLLSNRLKGRPLAPSRRGEGEANPSQLLLAAQVGDRVDVDLEAPEVSGQLIL